MMDEYVSLRRLLQNYFSSYAIDDTQILGCNGVDSLYTCQYY